MKKGEPWFEDGNLILLATSLRQPDNKQVTGFRIHRGFLARQSELFRPMLDLPQPEHETKETMDLLLKGGVDEEWVKGCQFVQMHDDANELGELLTVLYDGFKYRYSCIEDFFFLAGILRLSSKYLIANLRASVISALNQTWSHTLSGHDAMVDRALQEESADLPDNPVDHQTVFRYPYVHPLHVLNLARQVDAPILVPPALYFLSMYPLADILRADHPKLVYGQNVMGDVLSTALSREDLENVALMYEHRIVTMLEFCRTFILSRQPSLRCKNITATANSIWSGENPCRRGFASLSSKASRSWFPRTGPLKWMTQVVQMADRDGILCEECRKELRVDVTKHREVLWEELPKVVRMSKWEELAKDDLDSR